MYLAAIHRGWLKCDLVTLIRTLKLEWESKSTETVQYIGNGKIKSEMGMWKWEQSARLKQNNEDRNVVRDLRGHLGVSDTESDDIALEVSGVSQSLGEW